MKQEHCKELNEILTSKPHTLERYGIIIIVSILLLIGITASKFEHIEHVKIPYLNYNNVDSLFRFDLIIDNNSQDLLARQEFILKSSNDKIDCVVISTACHNTELFSVAFKPKNQKDFKVIENMISDDTNNLAIELKESYFKIITSSFFRLLKTNN